MYVLCIFYQDTSFAFFFFPFFGCACGIYRTSWARDRPCTVAVTLAPAETMPDPYPTLPPGNPNTNIFELKIKM